jgi:hypothetical protein
MNSVGLTQVFSHEQGLAPESIACILCLRYLKATDSHSITAFSLNQEPALTAHDTQWRVNWCNPTLPVTLSVCVSKSAPYYCFRCIFFTIHSHNSCDPDLVLITSDGLSVSTPLGKQPDPPRIRVDRASRLLAPDRQHKPVR